MNEIISIIVPVYNVENFLYECYESIASQTYKNLEIIFVDDGSTDGSLKILNKIKKFDSRVKIYTKENGGLSSARNLGIKKSSGKYLCFVDSDDYLNPIFIERLYNLIYESNCEISVVNYYKTSKRNLLLKNELDNDVKVLKNNEALSLLLTDEDFGNYAWNKMYNRILFKDVLYPVGRKMEDIGTTYKLISKCEKIVYSRDKLYMYYQREDSIMHKIDYKLFVDMFELSYERYMALKKFNINNDNNLAFLNIMLICYPYLSKELKTEIELLINNINAKNILLFKMNLKQKIRFLIYIFNRKIYIKLFEKG